MPNLFGQIIAALALVFSAQAFATQSDDFTKAEAINTQTNQPDYSWVPIGYACMTAGSSAGSSTNNPNYNNLSASTSPQGIPGCNYGTPDTAGSGALRLTPASNNQHGAIVSTNPFPTTQGLQVTFTTYSYGGNSGGNASDGADGISFFLIDPSQYANIPSSTLSIATNLGSWGGSLAYSCSNVNTPYVGLTGGYLGLGMDEYGNFLNGGSGNDNTATGIPVQTTNTGNGANTFGNGGYQQSNRIGLRGAGNVSWPWLNANYPWFYPSTLSTSAQNTAVQKTCQTGTLWDFSAATVQPITNATVSGTTMTVTTSNGTYAEGYVNGDSVTIGGTITANSAVQSISGNPAVNGSGTTMTVDVPSVSGYTTGESVVIAGTITETPITQNISNATVSTSAGVTTMTVTVPSVAGYSNGASVNIGGSITASETVTASSASVSGSTMTVTVPSTAGFSVGENVSFTGLTANNTQNITGNPTVSGTTMTVTVPSVANYTVSEPVTLAGLTASTTQAVSAATVNGTTMTVTVPSTTGYATNGTVSLTGLTANTQQNISGTPTVSGSTMSMTVGNGAGFASGESVTIGGTITASTTQTISAATLSGTPASTLTLTVPSTTGMTSGSSITLAGLTSITSQSISSATVSGSTMTVTVPNGAAYAAGESVTIGGTITASTTQSISSATVSGTTMTVTVPSTTGMTTSSSITLAGLTANTSQNITAVSGSGTTMTVTVGNIAGFAAGESVTIGGTIRNAAGTSVAGTYTINSISGSTFKVTIASTTSVTCTGTCTAAAATAPVATGALTIVTIPSGTTFTVTLNKPANSITASSATAAYGTAPTVTGAHSVVSVSGNTFTVALSGNAYSITNTSGTVAATTAPTVNGSLSIASVVNSTQFRVTLNEPVASITLSSATATYGTAPTVTGAYTIASVSGNTLTVTLGSPAFSISNSSGTVAATTAPTVNGSQTIASVPSGSTFTVTLSEPANTISTSSATATYGTAPNPSGSFTIKSINTGTNTFTVTLSANANSITSSSGTATTSAVTIAGTSYTIASIVNGTQFTVALGGNPASITDSSGTASVAPPTVTGTYPISNLNTGAKTFTVTLPSVASAINNATSGTAALAGTPSVDGTYTITSINSGNRTFTVTLTNPAASITNTSGTVSQSPFSATGTYTISGVSDNGTSSSFNVTLAATATSITNTSGTVIDNTNNSGGRNTNTAPSSYFDYPVIPGGYYVLPNSQKLADEGTSVRTGAWPVTYKLQITPNGLLNFFYSYNGGANQTVLSGWPITSNNGPLPANFLFGFAGSTGGSNNTHEITCFDAEPMESSTSAAANTIQAGQVRTSTVVYLASYNLTTVSGSLVAEALVNTNGVISVASTANWDGSCVLTGGSCTDMNPASPPNITAEPPAYSPPGSYSNNTNSRQLLTWSGTQGVGLEWTNLTAAQQTLLNSTDSYGQYRLNWLRGDRSEEQTAATPGPLRVRAGVLGDTMDSSPLWVGPPSGGFGAVFTDTLYGNAVTPPETSYTAFATSLTTRLNVVYAGANDGLLHGFRAGSFLSDGVTPNPAVYNDGYEVIGFMPSTVLANSNVVSLTNPSYNHDYFVDAPPGGGDLFYGGSWHTWLVSGLGAGGNEIFALDVTDPAQTLSTTTPFSEANAASLVMGDWTSATLTCQTVAGVSVSSCGNNLGQTYGTPIIRRLHNGQWALIFGNGLSSTNGHAGIFIGLVNASTAAVTFYWLDTGSGSSSSPNGIEYVASADLDGDHITDYFYAGDLLGNVWRFDVTSTNIADWKVSTFGQPSAAPLFTAGSSGDVQPITTRIAVTATTTGGAQRLLLGFGTGQATPPATVTSNPTYTTATPQTVYGIWDWNMTAWNSGTTTAHSVTIPPSQSQYAALAEVTSSPYRTFTRSSLLVNSTTSSTISGVNVRSMQLNDVCWQGTTICPTANNPSTANNEYGWLYDLPGSSGGSPNYPEQIIYSPVFSGGALFVNTTIPAAVPVTGQCKPSLPGGWSMSFNMASGGGFTANAFPNPATGSLTNLSSGSITGLQEGGVGTPFVVSVGTQQYVVSPNVGGGGGAVVNLINPPGGVVIKRMTWEELR